MGNLPKLGFNQKVGIIDHLALPDNWSNIFNMDFFADETRKWTHKEANGLTVLTSDDDKKCKVIDADNGRSLLIEQRSNNRIKVTDEHGQSFILSQGKVKSRGDTVANVAPIQSTNEFGFDDETAKPYIHETMGVIARFNDDGSKSIFFEDLGHRVDMNTHGDGINQQSHPGQFFHKISFDDSTFKEWDIHPAYAMMFAKLVIAKDLNIEPSLKAFNELDEDKAATLLMAYLEDEYDEEWDGPEAWRAKKKKEKIGIEKAEKPWNDTTEFKGYQADLPSKFFIQKTNDGYDLTTSSDSKHSILAQGALLQQARKNNILSIQSVNENTATQSVLHMLNQGHSTEDHLGREWSFVVLQSNAARKIVDSMNAVAHNTLGVSSNDYAAINFSDNESLIAMETETLKRVTMAYSASLEVMDMIKNDDNSQDRLEELLEMGADYRFIDQASAFKGNSFADVMREAENYALLNALENIGGIHSEIIENDNNDNTLDL